MLILRIIRNVLAWIGVIAVVAVVLALVIGPTWCMGEGCTVQGWFSALSGWAAAVAAAATLGLLWRQTMESVRTANTSQAAFEHAQLTTRQQLRAYLALDTSQVSFGEGSEWKVAIVIRNAGQTPAIDVNVEALTSIRPEDLKTLPEKGTCRDLGPLNAGELLKYNFIIEKDVEDFIKNAKAEGPVFYTYIKLTYHDIFGELHHTSCKMTGNKYRGNTYPSLSLIPGTNMAD